MRVVHVITKGDVGGAQTHVAELVTTQIAAGLELTVIAGSDGPALQRCREAGASTGVVPSLGAARSRPWERRALRDLRAAIDEARPDIVHAHSSNAGLLARVACRQSGHVCVYTAHGWPFQAGAALSQRVLSFVGEAVAGRLGAGVICLTDVEADRARRARVVRAGRLWVIPNGLMDVEPALVRRHGTGPVGVMMVARFAPPKLQRELIDVMSTLTDLDWRLTFIGDGPQFDEVRRHGASTLGERVSFLGHRDDVAAQLADNDISVLWSRYEGMPISLLESMRAGLCCVASDLPGVRTLFGSEGAGVVASDEQHLEVALRELVRDHERRARLGVVARRRFESHYSAEAMEVATRAVYDELLARA
jgi:glycosyltransferase involved in cell wall biosynthesis